MHTIKRTKRTLTFFTELLRTVNNKPPSPFGDEGFKSSGGGLNFQNPISGRKIILEPEDIALYRWLIDYYKMHGMMMSGKILEKYDAVRFYFKDKWTEEYSILLD